MSEMWHSSIYILAPWNDGEMSCLRYKVESMSDWLPTPESINALPEPLRRYIHDLESFSGAELIQENFELRQNFEGVKALALSYKTKPPSILQEKCNERENQQNVCVRG